MRKYVEVGIVLLFFLILICGFLAQRSGMDISGTNLLFFGLFFFGFLGVCGLFYYAFQKLKEE